MVVSACKVIFFYGSGIKILTSLSKYPTEVDYIEKWSSVYMLMPLKNDWLYHKRRETKCIPFPAFWCFASGHGKGLKPKWCCHLLSLILCLTEMLQCVWKWHLDLNMFVSFQRHTDVMTCRWAASLPLMYIYGLGSLCCLVGIPAWLCPGTAVKQKALFFWSGQKHSTNTRA